MVSMVYGCSRWPDGSNDFRKATGHRCGCHCICLSRHRRKNAKSNAALHHPFIDQTVCQFACLVLVCDACWVEDYVVLMMADQNPVKEARRQ